MVKRRATDPVPPPQPVERRKAERRVAVSLTPWTLDGGDRTRVAVRRAGDAVLIRFAAKRGAGAGGTSIPVAVDRQIALAAHRFAAGTGATITSNGIPLAPGQLLPTQASTVRLMSGQTELACYVEVLNGTHTDGTARSVLVQCNAGTMTNGTPVTGLTLSLGITASVARLTKDTTAIAPWTSHQGALLPTSADHLVASNIWLGTPLLTLATTPASPAFIPAADTLYATKHDTLWTSYADQANRGIAEYDHGVHTLQMWARTATVKYFDRAFQMGQEYWNHFANNAAYDTELGEYPWLCNPRMMATYYLISGDTRMLDYMGVMANHQIAATAPFSVEPTQGYGMAGPIGDDRLKARALQSAIYCDLVGVALQAARPNNYGYIRRGLAAEMVAQLKQGYDSTAGIFGGDYYSKTSAGNYTTGIAAGSCMVRVTGTGAGVYRATVAHTAAAATQPGVGADWATVWALLPSYPTTYYYGMATWVSGRAYQPGEKSYMVGMLLQVLIQYYELVSQDSAVIDMVQGAVDWLWANSWSGANQGFRYVTVDNTNAEGDTAFPSWGVYGLNGMMLAGFGWLYSKSRGASYKTNGDTIAALTTLGQADWAGFGTQMDESYLTWHEYLYHRT